MNMTLCLNAMIESCSNFIQGSLLTQLTIKKSGFALQSQLSFVLTENIIILASIHNLGNCPPILPAEQMHDQVLNNVQGAFIDDRAMFVVLKNTINFIETFATEYKYNSKKNPQEAVK
jgi:hypothetical protein